MANAAPESVYTTLIVTTAVSTSSQPLAANQFNWFALAHATIIIN